MCEAIEIYGEQRELRANIRSALKMIADNLPLEKIAEYTGLPLEKVQELANGKSA